jgi:hypothetical protein
VAVSRVSARAMQHIYAALSRAFAADPASLKI